MSIEQFKAALPDYAKDIRLNLGKVLSEDGAPGLTQEQIYGTALACAYATRHPQVIAALEADIRTQVPAAVVEAARAAATIMAMNNIYYRFTHLVHDDELRKLPANLRMQVIASPSVPKVEFELYSLAVSAINGCGMCMEAHVHEVSKGGIEKVGAHSAVRIAAVINAAAQALTIQNAGDTTAGLAAAA